MGRIVTDKYKYRHELTKILSAGGQGTVWRTTDPETAVKLAGREDLSAEEQRHLEEDTRNALERLTYLPIPPNIGISMPKAPLEDAPGYSMFMLRGMRSFAEAFDVRAAAQTIADNEIPDVAKSWGDEETVK